MVFLISADRGRLAIAGGRMDNKLPRGRGIGRHQRFDLSLLKDVPLSGGTTVFFATRQNFTPQKSHLFRKARIQNIRSANNG